MHIRTSLVFWILLFPAGTGLSAQTSKLEASACHLFIDYDFIFTLEMVGGARAEPTPILNVIALSGGRREIEPDHVHIINGAGEEAVVYAFSFDTGDPKKPYNAQFLRIIGGESVGVDLVGKFTNFREPTEASIELDEERHYLEPIKCAEFDRIVDKIAQLELDDPDLVAAFERLNIPLLGRLEEP